VPLYTLYGLSIRSDTPIAGLQSAPGPVQGEEIEIRFGSLPSSLTDPGITLERWYESPESDAGGDPVLVIERVVSNDDLWLRYSDGCEFLIDSTGGSVFAVWPESLTLDDAIIYFLGPVIGILLRVRGRTALHASVVSLNGEAVGFLGQAGAGKSTIAGAFARAGYPVLSDDLLPLEERGDALLVQPGYSRLRLWPSSVRALYGSEDALPLLVDGWEKRFLDLEAASVFEPNPLPLGAIYLIGERQATSPRAVFEDLPRRIALLALAANSYPARLPGRDFRRGDFEFFGELLSKAPLRQVSLGSEIEYLETLPESVLEDLDDLAMTAPR
jgi:hypothetical protein